MRHEIKKPNEKKNVKKNVKLKIKNIKKKYKKKLYDNKKNIFFESNSSLLDWS